MSKPRVYLSLWAPPAIVMIAIFGFSAMPAGSSDHGLVVFVLRKIAHFSEYAILLALLWRALRESIPGDRALVVAYAICVGYAITDEFHQTFISGRVGTWRDVVIDGTGAAVAALLVRRFTRSRPVAAARV